MPPSDIYVLSARDAGRIMAMMHAMVSAMETLLDARIAPLYDCDGLDENELAFDEAESGLHDDPPLERLF